MSPHDVAKLLLEVKAVSLNLDEPFRYASGILSPIYCDNRIIISHPAQREQVVEAFISVVREHNLEFDVVAGTATAGIPHAAWIAERLGKPMIYVRGQQKGHGKKNKIEGEFEKGAKVIIVEDLVSTGGSAINAGLAVRDAGGVVTDCLAIFTYEMEKAMKRFKKAEIVLHTLTNFSTLVNVASLTGYIPEEEADKVLAWNMDPEGWGETMGYE